MQQSVYKDLYVRIVFSIIAANVMVLYYDEESLFEAMFSLSYLVGFLGSFLIALFLTWYISFVTMRLDHLYDWHIVAVRRLFWQTIMGLLLPAILAFVLAALFFYLFSVNIMETKYLKQDYTLVIVMLITLNLYYFGLSNFYKVHACYTENRNVQVNSTEDNGSQPEESSKEIVVVNTLTHSIPVRISDICYCYILSGSIFIRTFEMQSIQESHQLSTTLRAMEELLDSRMFFRINRRMIVNFESCRSYSSGKNKTLKVVLDPEPYGRSAKIPEQHQRLTIVSEDRAALFKIWMDR